MSWGYEVVSKAIVEAIVDDIMDRSGLSNEWDMIDHETREGIMAIWTSIVRGKLERWEK